MKAPSSARSKRIAAAAIALLFCVPLAACSAGWSGASGESSQADLGGGIANHDNGELFIPSEASDGLGYDQGTVTTSELRDSWVESTSQTGRSVISTGELYLEVDDTNEARDSIVALIEGLGGRVESQTIEGSDASSAYLTVRVPANQFDAAYAAMSEVGKVLNESRSAADVTMEHVDLQARIAALEASIDRLTELMSGATSTGDLIEAEAALSQRQAELDSLKGQLTYLDSQISESTIWVSLREKSALPGGPANFWDGLLAGLNSIVVAGSGALVLLGVLLPWIVVLGLIAFVIVLAVRASRKRKHAAAATNPKVETAAAAKADGQPPTQAE